MMKQKYRAWDVLSEYYFTPSSIDFEKGFVLEHRGKDIDGNKLYRTHMMKNILLEQFIGLSGFYIGDIGQFDNGDTFIIRMNNYLHVYIEWVGTPIHEHVIINQSGDLSRIKQACKIGNVNENPYLTTTNPVLKEKV